ncbi:MAG: hypothetical protein ABEI13_03040, partial [Candidatus Paceibacteria bacterium]
MRIYDSEGVEYRRDGRTGERDRRIEGFASAGLRFGIKTDLRTEIILFFRASESTHGRSELFYAIDELDDTGHIRPIRDFKQQLQQTAEELGLIIDRNANNMEIFRKIDTVSSYELNSDLDYRAMNHVLSKGQRLQFAVNQTDEAIRLAKTFINESADGIAICDVNPDHSSLQDFDLVFQIDPQRVSRGGRTPLGDTRQKLRQGKKEYRENLVSNTIDSIRKDIRQLKQDTSLSDEDIRDKVFQEISTLKPPRTTDQVDIAGTKTSGSTKRSLDDGLRSSKQDKGIDKVKVLAIGMMALAALIIITVGIFGIPPLGVEPLLGGDGMKATATYPSNGTEIWVNGSLDSLNKGKKIQIVVVNSAGIGLTNETYDLNSKTFNKTIKKPRYKDISNLSI